MISTLKWLEYLYLTGTFARFYNPLRFDAILLDARLEFVTLGVL